jgi:hypothetical protein
MQAALDRSQAQLVAILKILGQYRVIIGDASERPAATGSGVLFLESDTALAFWDDPDTSTWVALVGSSGAPPSLDTTNFDGILSASEDDIQKAADVLDDHNHNADYLPAAIGGTPTAGHFTKLASVAVPPPSWALSDSGYGPTDFLIVDDEGMHEFAVADAQPNKYLNYVGGVLDTIDIYDATPTKLYEKQFNYVGGVLDNIVLTRISDSATWTKTLTYAGGVLEEIEVA